MKPNQPSLILYFATIFLTIILECVYYNNALIVYLKSMGIPLIFIYFLITNNYKINWIQSLIFLFCFVGDVILVVNPVLLNNGPLFCFILVYLLLFFYVLQDYRKIKFTKHNILPIVIIVAFMLFLFVSIMQMKTIEREVFAIYLIYGIVLILLCFICFLNYVTRSTVSHLFLTLMAIAFIISDLFYIFNKYYHDLFIFRLIKNTTQVLAYYFMVRYFLTKNDNSRIKD